MPAITLDDLTQIINVQSPWRTGVTDSPFATLPPVERKITNPIFSRVSKMLPPGEAQHEVILGPRRVGKTTLLKHMAQRLCRETDTDPKKVVFISLDDPKLAGCDLNEIIELLVHITDASMDAPMLLLVDEVAHASRWDLSLKNTYDFPDRFPVKIIATSSSALEMQRGSIESGVGRWRSVHLFPCQLKEQCEISGLSINMPSFKGDTLKAMLEAIPDGHRTSPDNRELLDSFMAFGGFPGKLWIGDTQVARMSMLEYFDYIRTRQNKVIDFDLGRHANGNRSSSDDREHFWDYLVHHPCELVDLPNISKDLEISKYILGNLFRSLEDAMVSFRLQNYSGPRKQKKSYFYDNSIPASAMYADMSTMLSEHKGWARENMVATALWELTKHSIFGVRLFHLRDDQDEVDFVLKENNQEAPLALEVASSSNHSRSSLNNILDKFPEFDGNAYLIAPDATADTKSKVKTLPLFEFLLAVEYRKDILMSSPSEA